MAKDAYRRILYVFFFTIVLESFSQTSTLSIKGWAKNSVNGVIFRRNSVVTHQTTQYTAFYDSLGNVVIAKRQLGSNDWTTKITPYKGNILDAHNSISIMVDGSGYLHLSWDHHNNALNYCKSLAAGSLELGNKQTMIGSDEGNVTYPEFHLMPSGDVIFMYRNGASGNGNLVINKYSIQQQRWQRVHSSLIDGQGLRNAYWQTFLDANGTIHLSWVWRESSDVASNHDICYAKSTDGGVTWKKSNGNTYTLPIVASTAEYAAIIPQNSNLINQTSMYGDNNGNPYICNYWTTPGSSVPQYRLVYHNGVEWQTKQISNRTSPFSLSGGGTKKIPVSRPQIMVDNNQGAPRIFMIYRDLERNDKVSLSYTTNLLNNQWATIDLTDYPVSSWEPSYDTELWKKEQKLHIFVQRVGQGDGEGLEQLPAQPVTILEWLKSSLSVIDCNGDAGGKAYMDACKKCVGGNTNIKPCDTNLQDGFYVIRPMHSQLCLQPGSTVAQQPCNNQQNQGWQLINEAGFYAIKSYPDGTYLNAPNAPTASTVTMTSVSNVFKLEDALANTFHIVSTNDDNLVMDMNNASTAPGTRALVYRRTGGNNQRFYFYKSDCEGLVGGSSVCAVTSYNDENLEKPLGYPNPCDHEFFIQHKGSFIYTVFDAQGIKILDGRGSDHLRIETNMPSGIYNLKIQEGIKVKWAKLVKL